MTDQYERSCVDEIDFVEADQMHSAALQISQTSFDFKKLCVSLIGAIAAILLKFGDGDLNHEMFVVGMILVIGFWLSDATAYFYQKKLRKSISKRYQLIAARNNQTLDGSTSNPSALRSLFNASMLLYYSLLSLLAAGWLAFFSSAL